MFEDKVIIIDYSRGDYEGLISSLEDLGAEYELSKIESTICKSKKVILPDAGDIGGSIKKLQLLNMFSMLKMVNKPMLGINAGLYILCESICDISSKGLAFFPVTASPLRDGEGSWKNVKKISNSILLDGIEEPLEFFFKEKYTVPVTELSQATFSIESSEYSAVLQNKNIFGTVFNPELSGEKGKQVLKNFLSL
ncbi:MAG: hypothetical protein V1720_09305 [bacterium]